MSLLEGIKNSQDIKKLSVKQLPELADEIRQRIINVVGSNGGHLSSNLGAVDIIVALHYVFDFPNDKLFFDVGHQSYAHKILSGRNDEFDTIRLNNGLSGFPNPNESEYDSFCAGHAGNSISACLGQCIARDALGDDYNVIDIVGDASLFNGENLEAITSSSEKPSKFIVIINDNGMSISVNNNGLYKFISKMTTKKSYSRMMYFAEKTIGKSFIGKGLKKFKRSIKYSLSRVSVVESVGFKYIGIFDGHKIKELVRIFSNIKDTDKSIILHLKTIKGKGYADAEKNADYYHGVSKDLKSSENSFSKTVGEILCRQTEKNPNIAVVCAGMKDGTGLREYESKFSDKFYDVGIAEEHAVTFSAGLAKGGILPFVCIYSTFLQRAYDQILHDVCLQNAHVIFLIDRAGAVGSDGATHQGLFDISYLRSIPNMRIFAPTNISELSEAIEFCTKLDCPCAIRYPNGYFEDNAQAISFDNSLWIGDSNCDNVILAVGPRTLSIANEVKRLNFQNSISIVNARSVKPLDETLLDKISQKNIITIEENVISGGFGSAVLEYYATKCISVNCHVVAFPDNFVAHATVNEQLSSAGITAGEISKFLI